MTTRFYAGFRRLCSRERLRLAACSGDANPVRDTLVATGVGAQPKPAPDFVAASRPQTIDYIPVAPAPAKTAAKSADQVKAAEAAMDKTRTANEARPRRPAGSARRRRRPPRPCRAALNRLPSPASTGLPTAAKRC